MSPQKWRSRVAGAFQDFFRFEFRARHTVGVGDLVRLEVSRAVAAAMDRAGATDVVTQLVAGLETQLGATRPEVEISFGQWQKLALARGFMRELPLLVVDGSRVVESGTREALMAKGGQYAELYGIQAAATARPGPILRPRSGLG